MDNIILYVMKSSLDLYFRELSISQIFHFKFAAAGHCAIYIHCIVILAATCTLIVSSSQLLICPLTFQLVQFCCSQVPPKTVASNSNRMFSSSFKMDMERTDTVVCIQRALP